MKIPGILFVFVASLAFEAAWGCFDGRVFTYKRCCEQNDPACWTDPQYTFGSCCCFQGGFTEAHCCHSFDAACWDARFNFDSCCARPTDILGVENSERWQRYMARADAAITALGDDEAPGNYQKLWRAVNDVLAAIELVGSCTQEHRKFAVESGKRLLKLAGKKRRISLAKTIDLNRISDQLSADSKKPGSVPKELPAGTEELRSEILFPTKIARKVLAFNDTEILVVSALRAYDAVKREGAVGNSAEEANNVFFARQMEDGNFWHDRKSEHFARLKKSLAEVVREFSGIEKFQISMWASVYEPNGAFIKFHDHPLAVISGVFFPEDCETPLVFGDPRGGLLDYADAASASQGGFEPQAPFHRAVHLKPRKNEVVLFPPWLLHRTARHLRGDFRVVFAFNIYTDDLAGAWSQSLLLSSLCFVGEWVSISGLGA